MSMQPYPFLKATTALSLLLASVVIRPAYAVDGVIEINQVRAKAGGVTPGDTPLFPVTIDLPGSYRLTSNLDVTDATARRGGTSAENTTAIDVTVDDVTIDLNGFMIKGLTSCVGIPLVCSQTGSGMGIQAVTRSGVAAKNGTVRGMGSNGVSLGNHSVADNIRAVSNGRDGVEATVVTNSTANRNGGDGIDGDSVANCTAVNNGLDGISGTTVINSSARNNDGDGIAAQVASGSSAASNTGIGINVRTAIGCTAFSNTGVDIFAGGVADHNTCSVAAVPCP
jgi:hypothetical protein